MAVAPTIVSSVSPDRTRFNPRAAVASALYNTGLLRFYLKSRLRNSGLVLMYHRVVPESARPELAPGMYVTDRTLELQLRYLAAAFDIVSLADLYEWILGRRTFSRTPCVITFDDGWADNYRTAFPILKALNVKATIFLITDAVGTSDMLTWDQVREMESAGISFGSHTATHPKLTTKGAEAIAQEVQQSKAALEREVARPSNWFCYPKGEHNAATRAQIEPHFDGALTVEPGPVRRGDDLFTIRRIGVHNDISSSVPLFAFRLGQRRRQAKLKAPRGQ